MYCKTDLQGWQNKKDYAALGLLNPSTRASQGAGRQVPRGHDATNLQSAPNL